MPYIKSFCVIVDGDRYESSPLEDRNSDGLLQECKFKQILVNSLKWLLFQVTL